MHIQTERISRIQFRSSMYVLLGGRQMGSIEKGLFLIFFSYLCICSTSSPLWKVLLSSVPLQETHLGAKFASRYGSGSVAESGGSGIKHNRKIEGAHGHGATSGVGSNGNGENGNNGGTKSPNTQGGTATIPVYAAGAANNRHHNHHRGSGNRNRNSLGLSILVANTLAALLAGLYY
ncbi:uncharacterized protein LOC121238684 [Juglans microcarpa x Juglans regia]|uniref:uncharacterized protein LOC121238684 n=1 Tax=Juglans microcarpa x Juglans regia TaxID=2249226 RepID=UPI001B7E297E|nr:uncharacterized protein LOC121238684 [Juglans microcarpa x Juglans regia]